MSTHRIGFLGAGKMATALAKGFIHAGFAPAECIVASDVSPVARTDFTQSTGCPATEANRTVVDRSDILVLAVKPQVMSAVLAEIAGQLNDRHLVVSIAAGIPLKAIEGQLGPTCRVVRVMPNTPALVGAGAAAYSCGRSATTADAGLVQEMFTTVGLAVQVSEPQLDAVTGLSGSGPAYVFQMIEALSDGGVRVGLPRPIATQLAIQTVLGAARLALETGEHPAQLKDAVTSPGGTTIAGLHELERGGLRGILMNAVHAATVRSRELGAN